MPLRAFPLLDMHRARGFAADFVSTFLSYDELRKKCNQRIKSFATSKDGSLSNASLSNFPLLRISLPVSRF